MDNVTVPFRRLFKYVAPHIAKLMTERGSVRVGTLQEYRSMEAAGDVRGDAGEGTKRLSSPREPTLHTEGSALHEWMASKNVNVFGGISTNSEKAIVSKQCHQDCFIYCVSETFSPELMEKFGGACVVITNPMLFFQSLNAHICAFIQSHLPPSLRYCVVDRCAYAKRQRPFHDQIAKHPCFVKPVRFSDEAEVRAIWIGNGQPLAHIIKDIPELIGCLQQQ